jgi:hypothetical protein
MAYEQWSTSDIKMRMFLSVMKASRLPLVMNLAVWKCQHLLQPGWLKALRLFVHMRREATAAPAGSIAEPES